MTKLEKVLGDFSEMNLAKRLIKSIDRTERNAEKKYPESIERHKIEKIPTIEGKLKYAKEKNLEDRPYILGSIESAESSGTPKNDKELRSRAAKYGAITKAENKFYGKDMAEGKPGDKKSKLKKALKVAGVAGGIGALGAAGAIAGDALNLWDLGKVEGIAGKVLSPLDKAGNALNAMASAPTVNQLNEVKVSLKQAENKYQDLVDEVTKVGLSYDQGNEIHIHPKANTQNGGVGVHIATHDPLPVNLELESTIPMDVYRKLMPTSRSYK